MVSWGFMVVGREVGVDKVDILEGGLVRCELIGCRGR